MTKRKREYPVVLVQGKGRVSMRSWRADVLFWVLAVVVLVMGVVWVGNKFWTVSETCTVESVEYTVLDSNSGGIVSRTPFAYVHSSDCPTISFDKVPAGLVSLEQLPKVLEPGRAYEFEVGFFRLELLGLDSVSWRGVGVRF